MNLLTRLKGGREEARDFHGADGYVALLNQFGFNGIGYGYGMLGSSGITQTLGGRRTEMAPNDFIGLAQHAYGANGVVFACMLVRQLVFSSVRFQWQKVRQGKPSDTFYSPALKILETPWAGGTTQDLLSRMIQDADLAGNSYWVIDDGELVRLRPDWVDIVVEERHLRSPRSGQIGWRKAGYIYTAGGTESGNDPVGFLPDEMMHFMPIPDPTGNFRGMSWLTPILREIQADQAMTRHQRKFFDRGATVNLIIKHAPGADQAAVKRWNEELESKFGGVENAYKNLNLYPGADVTPVGANLKDIDFKEVRGGGETRIAAAAGVPPVIVGLSEGLEAATYSNYGQARRRLADGTAHPLWQNAAGSMGNIIPKPRVNCRLWYDAEDVPFLREDEKDAAEIAAVEASTINTYITAGFEPKSVVRAVAAGDKGLLKHTGMYSVQLQKPGTDSEKSDESEPDKKEPQKEDDQDDDE